MDWNIPADQMTGLKVRSAPLVFLVHRHRGFVTLHKQCANPSEALWRKRLPDGAAGRKRMVDAFDIFRGPTCYSKS